MPTPAPEAMGLGRAYRLALGFDVRRGEAGEHLAKGTGSSLEFQDRRAYMPGDDVRHVDWRALARTNQLMVRQYREELLPHVELLLDGSASMGVEPRKQALALDLAALITVAARGQGFRVSVVLLEDRLERMDGQDFLGRGSDFASRRPLMEVLREANGLLRPGGLRILISDFLSPHDPRELLRSLARGPGGLALLQVLAGDDRNPPRDTALRLTDTESDEQLDLVLDGALRGRYLQRLRRLMDGLSGECARHAAHYLDLDAERPLELLCREELLRSGFLAPA